MTRPLSAGDFGRVGWEGGQGAAGPGYALLQAGAWAVRGSLQQQGKTCSAPTDACPGQLPERENPVAVPFRRLLPHMNHFGRVIPAGGLTPNTPRLKVFKTEDVVQTVRRGDFFVCPRSSAIHWPKGSWAEGTVSYPVRHKKLWQCLCRLRKGIRSCYQTSHECR